MTDWNLPPGATISRVKLHDTYSGRRQGGIAPCSDTPNVIIFTAPSGHQYGYFDGWHVEDGLFHYTGEGQQGDQELRQGNRALADHRVSGKAIRLFSGARGNVTYVGEFEVVNWYTTDAADVNGTTRKVIVFRLRPVEEVRRDLLPRAQEEFRSPDASPELHLLEPENHATEQFLTQSSENIAERREAALVQNYLADRRRRGLSGLKRLKIKPAGETQPLYTDLFSPDENLVIEAKGTVTREAVRSAVGQLLDYRRFLETPNRIAVLLPEQPRPDLLSFLRTYSVEVLYANGDNFVELD